jgi:hypothetical protein
VLFNLSVLIKRPRLLETYDFNTDWSFFYTYKRAPKRIANKPEIKAITRATKTCVSVIIKKFK